MFLSCSEKMREADHKAIYERGIPSTLLMTNAASHIVESAMKMLPSGKVAVVFCGCGNNGGDGVAAAYMLKKLGVDVCAYLIGSREMITADTHQMELRLIEYGGELLEFDENYSDAIFENCGLIIDAMFGIGLNSPLRSKGLAAARLINSSTIPVIAADIPSGVDANSGSVAGEAVRANKTITFSVAKPGHFIEPGCTYCGEIVVCDIGIPKDIINNALIDVSVIQSDELSLPKRCQLTHKYSYGRLLVLGGSVGYTGAVSLCSKAAVRSGAGVVFVGVPKSIYDITAIKNDEAVVFPLSDMDNGTLSVDSLTEIRARLKTASACVLGPGLNRSSDLTELVSEIIQGLTMPTVLDADALYALGQNLNILKQSKAPLILTPHEGEFKLLGGILTGDRLNDASEFSIKHSCILILKGHHTIAAFPDGKTIVCPYGNAGMAKGGSGDVLSGILGAMLCNLPIKEAVSAALYIHSAAGDVCAKKYGEYSMTPSDMINYICEITKLMSER